MKRRLLLGLAPASALAPAPALAAPSKPDILLRYIVKMVEPVYYVPQGTAGSAYEYFGQAHCHGVDPVSQRSIVPPGTVAGYPGTEAPEGWKLFDNEYDAWKYAFSIIGDA